MKKRLFATFLLATIALAIGCMGVGGTNSGGGTGTGGTSTTSTGGATNGGGGGSTVAVTMMGMAFTPQLVNAHPGDTVQWTNLASFQHTVNSDTGQAGLDSSTQFPSGINPNSVFTWTVPATATVGTHFFYHCNFHGVAGDGTSLGLGMTGEITVN
ncbi:MAG: hypothetical protein ACHQ50_05060 [Fimbriimonadales bacterium]